MPRRRITRGALLYSTRFLSPFKGKYPKSPKKEKKEEVKVLY
jgi:hypothetical protein